VLHTIPGPLQDRMEILRLHGYTELEKLEIAKQYLVRKQREGTGLSEDQIVFGDGALEGIIREYTREAGVRNLEREIGNVCRKVARRVVTNGAEHKEAITGESLESLLGVAKFRNSQVHEKSEVGLVTGLAWTEVGGSILQTEVQILDGKGKLTTTGQLGDVMQESMIAAMTWVRSHAEEYGIDPNFFQKSDIHIHVPSGGVPKDGPSAGAAMVTALVSLLTGRPVRDRLAMTGEMTLSGIVLPIGGVKEKVLGAKRAGIKEVLLPVDNEPNAVADLPPDILGDMKITYVRNLDEVLEHALSKEAIAPPIVPQPAPKQKPVGTESPRAIH